MSTEFNPATFEHEGVVLDASPSFAGLCGGCYFNSKFTYRCKKPKGEAPCASDSRPDGKNIIWVRAQEGTKA